jgi:predicted phosphodiesterase
MGRLIEPERPPRASSPRFSCISLTFERTDPDRPGPSWIEPMTRPSIPLRHIGLIGDVHCQAERLETAIVHLQAAGVEAIVCTGDLTDGFGDIDRCCDLLQAAQVITVLGNHDRWCIHNERRNRAECTLFQDLSARSQAFLSQLPSQVELQTIAGLALLCHGLGANDMGKLLPQDDPKAIAKNQALQGILHRQRYRYILNGHSHYRMVKTVGDLTVINGGTLRQGHDPGFLRLNFATGLLQPYDLLPDSLPAIDRDAEAQPLGANSPLFRQLAMEAIPAQPVPRPPLGLPQLCLS